MIVIERPEEQLERSLAAATGALHLATARVVDVLAVVLDEETWKQAGVRSPEHYVMWQCGVSRSRAEGLVALARRRAELPATSARFAAGELSEDSAASIAKRCPASHDARAAEQAPRLTHPQLQRTLRLLPPLVEPDPADVTPAPEPAPEPRDLSFHWGDDGQLHGRFVLPADEGALVEQALARHRQVLFDDAGNDADHVTWADALVRMANASLDGQPGADRDRYLVNIHLDADGDTPTRIHLGPLLPDDLAKFHTCDGRVRTFLREKGRVVAKGRTTRVVRDALRKTIEDRDGGCVHPLCTKRRWVDVHHLHHWENGGPTDPDNLVCLCREHHRGLHRGDFTITGNPELGTLQFHTATGRALRPPDPAQPAPAPEPPPGWSRPWGGRTTRDNQGWAAA